MQLFFLSSTEQNFLLRRRGWDIFVWRNVSVLEGVLGAARYCAEGTICNDRRSLQIQLGVWGRCEAPSRSRAGPRGQAPGSSEDASFYSTKNGPKIDAFCPGIVVEIIRTGRQKISVNERTEKVRQSLCAKTCWILAPKLLLDDDWPVHSKNRIWNDRRKGIHGNN